MERITKATIEAAWRNRGDGGGPPIRDHKVRGLNLAIHAHHATWRLDFRLPGRHPETGKRWPNDTLTLGRLSPAFHLDEARAAALEQKLLVTKGINPKLAEKAVLARQLVATAGERVTVKALVEGYTAARSQRWRPQTARAFEGDLREVTAALGELPVKAVTRRQLGAFLRDFHRTQVAAGHAGTRAERLRMLLGSLFSYAVDEDLIELSPAQRLPVPARSKDRDRVLDAREMATVWTALSVPHPGIGPGLMLALKLSLVLGQRIGAVGGAREPDVALSGTQDPDLTDSGPWWRIPGEPGTKAKRDRLLPLPAFAVALFREALDLPGRQSGGFVFRGKAAGAALAQQSISRAWGMLRRAGKVPADTTPHDLRRTARSWWPQLRHGQPKDVFERILGHAVGSKVERVYDWALWLRQQRAVLDAWARKLSTITEGGAEVIEIAQVADGG
jgi:integrase